MRTWLKTNAELTETVATVILVVCALVLVSLTARQRYSSDEKVQLAKKPPVVARTVENWQVYTRVGHIIGSEKAPLKIVEFADFQCPFCAQLEPTLDSLLSRYEGRVAVVYRHFPLAMHKYAWQAALASECAAEQDRFEAYHDLLFKRQQAFGTLAWDSIASLASVSNLKNFRRCIEEKRYAARLKRDVRAARQISTRGTPTLIIGSRLIPGAVPYSVLDSIVRVVLREII